MMKLAPFGRMPAVGELWVYRGLSDDGVEVTHRPYLVLEYTGRRMIFLSMDMKYGGIRQVDYAYPEWYIVEDSDGD